MAPHRSGFVAGMLVGVLLAVALRSVMEVGGLLAAPSSCEEHVFLDANPTPTRIKPISIGGGGNSLALFPVIALIIINKQAGDLLSFQSTYKDNHYDITTFPERASSCANNF